MTAFVVHPFPPRICNSSFVLVRGGTQQFAAPCGEKRCWAVCLQGSWQRTRWSDCWTPFVIEEHKRRWRQCRERSWWWWRRLCSRQRWSRCYWDCCGSRCLFFVPHSCIALRSAVHRVCRWRQRRGRKTWWRRDRGKRLRWLGRHRC
jgi:hypothetical protein